MPQPYRIGWTRGASGILAELTGRDSQQTVRTWEEQVVFGFAQFSAGNTSNTIVSRGGVHCAAGKGWHNSSWDKEKFDIGWGLRTNSGTGPHVVITWSRRSFEILENRSLSVLPTCQRAPCSMFTPASQTRHRRFVLPLYSTAMSQNTRCYNSTSTSPSKQWRSLSVTMLRKVKRGCEMFSAAWIHTLQFHPSSPSNQRHTRQVASTEHHFSYLPPETTFFSLADRYWTNTRANA